MHSQQHPHPYTYNGHRRRSYKVADMDELVEMRARQRTLEGTYTRFTLLLLGDAAVFVKLFDERFYNSPLSSLYPHHPPNLLLFSRASLHPPCCLFVHSLPFPRQTL